MFDDDDLFDLTDGSFEWDLLLDDDELEQDRKMRQDKKTQGDASKKKDKRGSVEKVGVAPDPKRVGPASWNLEYG